MNKKVLEFLKFCVSSVGSFLLDIAIFTIASAGLAKVISENAIVNHIILATIIARICSGIFNYSVNRLIFGGKSKGASGAKYLVVWLVQMLLSANLVNIVVKLLPMIHETIVKMIIDSLLFLISFFVQKKWVFKK